MSGLFIHRSHDEVVVGETGGAFVDEKGTLEIGYAVVESHWNRGYATAAVEAFLTKEHETPEVRPILAHTPLERPQSGRVLKKGWLQEGERGRGCRRGRQRRARRGVAARDLAPTSPHTKPSAP